MKPIPTDFDTDSLIALGFMFFNSFTNSIDADHVDRARTWLNNAQNCDFNRPNGWPSAEDALLRLIRLLREKGESRVQ